MRFAAFAQRGERVAVAPANGGIEERLRAASGLFSLDAPGRGDGIGYCGRDFRAYRFMTIARVRAFYGSLDSHFDNERFDADLARASLKPEFKVLPLKRAYQRALALAIVLAVQPRILVVEAAEEFDEHPAALLCAEAIRRVETAIVTFSGTLASIDPASFTRLITAGEAAG